MSTPRRRLRTAIAGLLLAVPLAVGAGYAATTGTNIHNTWATTDEPSAAPAAASSTTDLTDARRAAGEASGQASLLTAGTGQLVDGTGKLKEGAKELSTGAIAARDGAQELATGMTQLQAATGQLGDGATKIADGVGTAVDNIVGIEAVRGQLLTAIDGVLGDIKDRTDRDATTLRDQLTGFRNQVTSFSLDSNLQNQLNELKKGSRDLANQLAVPGYGFHDGIYSATNGASQLSTGLTELTSGVDEALASMDELTQGAEKIDTMAENTKTKLGGVTRALPADPTPTAASEPARSFTPMYAFLIAAGVLMGAITRGRGKIASVLALTALTGILFVVLGQNIAPGLGLSAAGIGALLAIAGMFGTTTAMRAFGPTAGASLSAVFAAAQAGIVGWVWNSATTSDVSAATQFVANLMPLNYPTAALTALGNNADPLLVWGPTGILAALAVIAVGTSKLVPARAEA